MATIAGPTAGSGVLWGSASDDTLVAGTGFNLMVGGGGADTFQFSHGAGSGVVFGLDGDDVLDFSTFSPREIGRHEDPTTHFAVIDAGGAGGQGANALHVELWGVHLDQIQGSLNAQGGPVITLADAALI